MNYYTQPAPYAGSQMAQKQQYEPSMQDFIYAFPKPRIGGRIAKPRSAGNSPSSTGRRRTTTIPHGSAIYRQPGQGQAPLNAAPLASAMTGRRSQSRPISWHPASRQPEYSAPSQYYQPNTMSSYNFPVTQAAQPQMMNPAIDGSMLQPMTADVSTMQQNFGLPEANHFPQESFMPASNAQLDGGYWDATNGLPFVPSMNDWGFDTMSMNQSAPSIGPPASNYGSVSSPGRMTEPATPDFLPIQHFGDETDLEKPEPEDELVGMGLYNTPDMFSDGSLYETSGKGLKLEETFTPSPQNDDEDDEDDEEPKQEEQPNPQQPSKPVDNMQKSFFFEDDEPTMPESRPSFNIAVPPCMNYGYGWI